MGLYEENLEIRLKDLQAVWVPAEHESLIANRYQDLKVPCKLLKRS